ncbi:MAG: AI-2E family transporter [Phycisphaerales bacterium]
MGATGEPERPDLPQAATDGGQGASPNAPAVAHLHLWEIQGVRDAFVILAVCAVVYAGYWMRSVTVPLLIALALAYLFEPLVQRLCRFRGVTRSGAVLILLLTVGVGFTFLLTFTVPIAIGQTVRLVQRVRTVDFSALAERVAEYAPEQYRAEIRDAIHWLSAQMHTQVEHVMHGEAGATLASGESHEPGEPAAGDAPNHAAGGEPHAPAKTAEGDHPGGDGEHARPAPVDDEAIRAAVRAELAAMGIEPGGLASSAKSPGGAPWRILGAIGASAEYVMDLVLGLVQFSLIAFLVPFYFYFFSISFPKVLDFGGSLIPARNRDRWLELIGAMDRAVSGFVRGRIVIAGIMGVLFALGWLLCGVPYAVALGLFVGALSLVPYLGGLGVPLAVGLLLFDQVQMHPSERMTWYAIVLWPSVVFVIVQVIEGYILTPVIAGKVTDLDPVTIVVVILAGGSVAGVYGMILAIPAAACGKIVLKEVILPRVRAWSRGDAPDPLPIHAVKE